jgi:hypothetical protein
MRTIWCWITLFSDHDGRSIAASIHSSPITKYTTTNLSDLGLAFMYENIEIKLSEHFLNCASSILGGICLKKPKIAPER